VCVGVCKIIAICVARTKFNNVSGTKEVTYVTATLNIRTCLVSLYFDFCRYISFKVIVLSWLLVRLCLVHLVVLPVGYFRFECVGVFFNILVQTLISTLVLGFRFLYRG
jgi:hypothetical protein